MTTSAPHRSISSPLTTLRLLWTASRHWDLRLVRLGGLLLVAPNERQPVRLLPIGRRARSVKPGISRLPWTTESGHDLRGGIVSERISEGHGQILPDKKKYAMQKKELAPCLQCGQNNPAMKNESLITREGKADWKVTVYDGGEEMLVEDLGWWTPRFGSKKRAEAFVTMMISEGGEIRDNVLWPEKFINPVPC